MVPVLRQRRERNKEKENGRVLEGRDVKTESNGKETDTVCLNASGAEMGRVGGVVLVPESTL